MLKQYYVCILNQQKMPKPITQKSQLFGLVLISFIVLGISTLFSLSKEENTETNSIKSEKYSIKILTRLFI